MQVLLVLARLALLGVFAASGTAKLVDRARARQSLKDFGVPEPLATPLTVVLIVLELGTAVALLSVATLPYGAVGALSLLVVFIVAMIANLARGRRPECNCFGQLHSEPVGWGTVARNVVLAALAGTVAWNASDPGTLSYLYWTASMTTVQIALSVAGATGLILLASVLALLLQVLAQQGRLLLRFEAIESHLGIAALPGSDAPAAQIGLPPGTRAPSFELNQVGAERSGLSALLSRGRDALLVFTNPNCGPCQALLPDLASWQRDHADTITVALVSEGSVAENESKITRHGIERVLVQEKREVAEAYQAYGTPAAVVVGSDGSIASFVAPGADAIRKLLRAALARNSSSASPGGASAGIGQPAPKITLRDLDGKSITNADLAGERTALIFWNPGCGFCQRMLPDLKAWELKPPAEAPRVVVISSGAESDIRAMGLLSRVAVDGQLSADFGAHGTPMAVLLDADGRVASGVAAGAQAVFELLK
jgi:thiol-disulfide isomerase/thioredoxin/uncharacterized membrane protein YphA (DoxX/SURF4 family)